MSPQACQFLISALSNKHRFSDINGPKNRYKEKLFKDELMHEEQIRAQHMLYYRDDVCYCCKAYVM